MFIVLSRSPSQIYQFGNVAAGEVVMIDGVFTQDKLRMNMIPDQLNVLFSIAPSVECRVVNHDGCILDLRAVSGAILLYKIAKDNAVGLDIVFRIKQS